MADAPTDEMIASAFTSLTAPRTRLLDAVRNAPAAPGLYAIYGDANAWEHLGLGAAPASTVLLVSRADKTNLPRELEIHFQTGRTAQSSVRRVFAGLLRDHLALRGLPRNQTKPEQLQDFAITDEQDAQLTAWMTERLEIATWEKPADVSLNDVEVSVLKRWSPPLNLRDQRSTAGAKVSAALKAMANDARTWAREHGHKL